MVPPPHSHDAFDETVYGLEGVLTFTIDGVTREIGPGDSVCIRRGQVHQFVNPGTVDAKFLSVATPGVFGPDYFTRDPRRADRRRGRPARRRRAPRRDAPPRPHARLTRDPQRPEQRTHEHALITALDDSYAHAAKVIADIDAGQLALPTPCAQWDVRATLDHLIGATWMFTLVNQDQAVGEDAGGIGGDDPVVGTHQRGRGQRRIVAGARRVRR